MMPFQSKPAFSAYSGSRQPRLLLVGEAWGANEEELQKPFSGESGKELFLMLGQAMPDAEPALHAECVSLFRYGQAWTRLKQQWLEAVGIGQTNVFNLKPINNDLESLCVSKADLPDKGKYYDRPALTKGRYLLPELFSELHRLADEVAAANPNIVVGLGNTACWAFIRATNIGSIRGTVRTCSDITPDRKFLPTYHPAGVLRQWSWRPIVIADLMKAAREADFPEVRRPKRQVLISPSLEEAVIWTNETLTHPPPMLSPDIETRWGQIACIGFARSRNEAIVIPFMDQKGNSYWPNASQEMLAWQLVQQLLESPIPKVFQNGMYDLQYIARMGIRPTNCREDTMLLHHSLYPEMLKGLGFLGSIYTSEPAWKLMRKKKADTEKADE